MMRPLAIRVRDFRASALLVCDSPVVGASASAQTPPAGQPLKLVIAGLVHGHVHSFLHSAADRSDVRLVGVYDPDPALLAAALAERKLPSSVGFTDLEKMLTDTTPEAMAIFSSTARSSGARGSGGEAPHARDDGEAARGERRRRASASRAPADGRQASR